MAENLIEKVLLLGIGAASLTRDKIDELAHELVKRGQMTREEGQDFVDVAVARAEKQGSQAFDKVSDAYQDTLRSLGIATRDHVDDIERRVAVLEAKIYGKPSRIEEPETGFVVTPTEEEEPT
ncbi:MAG: hypothetical protein M0Z32_07740 [Actinomycetota bacterium]|jgi:polyhydroxyalkanoate synthesis regulator phasin|nr:hypothetical protein [Actinomycetota bacterium]MCL6093969.1 hypothetical protein [Actinomycetota bacterium]MDA8167617.1 hypothetical protein [Actinomycetota bacterium]